ncbi:hypothetical protein CKO22_04200 [Thiococcus pfennigii]|nr:Wadjet anti-phage system protein JetD domain-containing protein [Thiococcus pfennigii]MBK1700140.1 hypothetical protein [Thiococcus pfennigii]
MALLEHGEVTRNKGNAALLDWLQGAGWIGQGPRRDQRRLAPTRRAEIEARLDLLWPSWRADLAALEREGFPCDPSGLRRLRRRHLPLRRPPARLHRKTWTARFGAHSKAGVPDEPPPDGIVALTDDDLLRLRPNQSLALCLADGIERPCAHWADPLGELVIPQRALDQGLALAGTAPRWVMTVENLGAFLDLPIPDDALVIHQPGWNTRLAARLIALLPPGTAWWHFGDLDPKGLAIFASLGDATSAPRHFIPAWWRDYLETHALALAGGWPRAHDCPPGARDPELVERLREAGLWLEQEAILMDPRLARDLARL